MDILYSKYTDYRNKEYQIYTQIVNDAGRKYVVKKNVYPEGRPHIEHILKTYERMKDEATVRYCPCMMKDGEIFFDFIEGESYKDRIEKAVTSNNMTEAVRQIEDYKNFLESTGEKVAFKKTDEFVSWFGDVDISSDEKSYAISNVDCNVGNVIFKGDERYLIDYEWVFDFPVPIGFIVYVNISWLYYFDVPELSKHYSFEEFMEMVGITPERIPVYAAMERNHQSHIGIDKDTGIDYATIKSEALGKRIIEDRRLDVAFELVGEKGAVTVKKTGLLNGVTKHTTLQLEIPEDTKKINIMIEGERACYVKWLYIYGDDEELKYTVNNGSTVGAYTFFDAKVPFITVKLDKTISSLRVTGHYHFDDDADVTDAYHQVIVKQNEINEQLADAVKELTIKTSELEYARDELSAVKNEIEAIKASRSWRIMAKFNGAVDKVRGVRR